MNRDLYSRPLANYTSTQNKSTRQHRTSEHVNTEQVVSFSLPSFSLSTVGRIVLYGIIKMQNPWNAFSILWRDLQWLENGGNILCIVFALEWVGRLELLGVGGLAIFTNCFFVVHHIFWLKVTHSKSLHMGTHWQHRASASVHDV